MKNLKASILVVNYNNGKYINQNINSLKNQTYKNIEIIYHDDNSTDNSLLILNKFKKIKLIKNKKRVNLVRLIKLKALKELLRDAKEISYFY